MNGENWYNMLTTTLNPNRKCQTSNLCRYHDVTVNTSKKYGIINNIDGTEDDGIYDWEWVFNNNELEDVIINDCQMRVMRNLTVCMINKKYLPFIS